VTAMQERALAKARERLGDRYETHFAEGRRMAAEDAVARLLSGEPEAPETRAY
jgi:hypothetical protein